MTTVIKSADRALKILIYLAEARTATAAEIRKALDLPKSSAHGLLETMVANGFLELNAHEEYQIGLAAFQVGSAWHPQTDVVEASSPILRRLVAEMNQIGHIGILDGTDVIYVVKHECERPIRLVSRVGKRLPAYATALGKILLGTLNHEEIRELYRGTALAPLTDHTITDIDVLLEAVRTSRDNGYAIDHGESTVGVTCYAAPIQDRHDNTVAAISLSTIDSSHDGHTADDYIGGVVRSARDISATLRAGTSA